MLACCQSVDLWMGNSGVHSYLVIVGMRRSPLLCCNTPKELFTPHQPPLIAGPAGHGMALLLCSSASRSSSACCPFS